MFHSNHWLKVDIEPRPKNFIIEPAQCDSMIEHQPVHQEVAGSILSQDTSLGVGSVPGERHVGGSGSMSLSLSSQ